MSNELTDVRCPCGAEFQADSYDAGFIAGSVMCQNCDAALPPKDICTCPSGDGSLRWPCPAHPAEQAGGDERAAFELFVRKHCGMPEHIAVNWDAKFTNDAWEGWQARAALAQPSPMRCLACGGYHGNSGLPCPNMRVTAQAQPSPAGVQLSASRERRIYIAGPMTGYKDCNFPAFNAQAEALRGLGYHVENPADHGVVDGAEWQDYLRYDISRLSTCEAIFLLPGWSKSKGAALEVYIAKALGMTFIHHADAEREQPSPVQQEEAPVIGCLCGMPMTEGHHSPDGCSSLEEFAPHLSAQAQAKQAERPEVVGSLYLGGWADQEELEDNDVELDMKVVERLQVDLASKGDGVHMPLMTVAQHERIAASRWERAMDLMGEHVARISEKLTKERDAALAEVERLRESKGDPSGSFDRCMKMMYERDENAKRLDAALARVEELDKQCRDDVARALGLRPSQERGFAWSYLLASIKSCAKASEDAAQAQHSVPEGYALIPVRETDAMHDAVMALLYKGVARTDTQKLLDAYIAAAPGKEGNDD
ncbi:DUF4406 domain-containing protein [Pseudomonas aeruginosa]